MPLHAAGLYSSPEEPKVFRYVISSYTPTVTALGDAQNRIPAPFRGVLAVSQPNTPEHRRLPGTITEVEHIRKIIGHRDVEWLSADSATIDAVISGMKRHSWLHLACHGVQHPTEPTKSAFSLHDGALDLARIISNDFQHADIAFLSACQTAAGDEQRPEEAVHLAAGMLVAGYRTVLATMWSIADDDAPLIAEKVYEHLWQKDVNGG